jgi:hypothetical protein
VPPLGACCFVDGHCEQLEQPACTAVGGESWTTDLPCVPNPCEQPGACCFADGSCTTTFDADCTGAWQGAGTLCEPNPCPQPGACCLPGSVCEPLTPEQCAALAGAYQGPGTVCDANPCICRGDLNCDGLVNFGDINPFVQILSEFAVWQQTHPDCPWQNGDIDGNGAIGFEDINPFVGLMVQSPIACGY